MASTSETGHAKNAANFEELVSVCKGYGAVYNPSNTNLTITSLETLLGNTNAAIGTLNSATPDWITAVNERETAFKPLSELTTRVVSALASSEVSKAIVDDAKTIARKIKGERAGKKSDKPIDPNNPDLNPKSISVSQMSFDNRIENFDRLIKLVQAQIKYTPNETDLSVAGLNTLITTLRAKNKDVTDTYVAVSNARTDRNNMLYKPVTGLVEIAKGVKAYVKSIFGASSPKYKQVAKIKFRQGEI